MVHIDPLDSALHSSLKNREHQVSKYVLLYKNSWLYVKSNKLFGAFVNRLQLIMSSVQSSPVMLDQRLS